MGSGQSRTRVGPIGYDIRVLSGGLHHVGVRGWYLHAASLGSVALCIVLWIRAKTVDQDERGNAERRALFVGLWAPQFWLMGDAVEREETRRFRHRLLSPRRPRRQLRAG